MYSISREFTFCYGHRLLDYNGKCAHPHGHNGRVEIDLQSENLNELGMVADFNDIKYSIEHWVQENLDHRMILQNNDPLVAPFQEQNEPVFLLDEKPTAENLAKLIYDEARRQGLPIVRVKFWETEKCSAEFFENTL